MTADGTEEVVPFSSAVVGNFYSALDIPTPARERSPHLSVFGASFPVKARQGGALGLISAGRILQKITLSALDRRSKHPEPTRPFRVTEKGMVLEHGHETHGGAEKAISGCRVLGINGTENGVLVSPWPESPDIGAVQRLYTRLARIIQEHHRSQQRQH